jgi:hypothetical protein
LRSLNAYVESALASSSGGFTTARQQAPGLGSADGSGGGAVPEQHTGCSAFAFQGTNAHVVLSSITAVPGFCGTNKADGTAAVLAMSAGTVYSRRRFWYLPPPHSLLASVLQAGGGSGGSGSGGTAGTAAVFDVVLGRPALAYLWQHQVGLMDDGCFLLGECCSAAVLPWAPRIASSSCNPAAACLPACLPALLLRHG